MGEAHGHHHHHQLLLHQQQRTQTHSRLGGLRGAGEIVEVQGGHIVRSTGRKDRHSKVCTAKGPRDRRVRLSAPTAIQFYDVQDRLGYDRPSKAVDWLMKNAKAAIDKLAELPAWNPTAERTGPRPSDPQDDPGPTRADANQPIEDPGKKMIPVAAPAGSASFGFGGGSGSSGSFLPPSLDSDAIADTIKSFFPMAATTPSSSPPLGYQNYQPELLSRSNSQDLRLSLQSFQDFHHHHSTHHHQTPTASPHQALFAGSAPLAFDATPASWPEQNQRMFAWNVVDTGGGGGGGGGGGYMFNVPPPQAVPLHPVLGHSQFFTQRGPLQSSNSPSVRAWADPMASASDHQMQPALHPSVSSIGFASGGSFSGFRIPARIQGEEEHDGISDKPSSAPHH